MMSISIFEMLKIIPSPGCRLFDGRRPSSENRGSNEWIEEKGSATMNENGGSDLFEKNCSGTKMDDEDKHR